MNISKITNEINFSAEFSDKLMNDIRREMSIASSDDKKNLYNAANNILKIYHGYLLDYEKDQKTKRYEWILITKDGIKQRLNSGFVGQCDFFEISNINDILTIKSLNETYNELYEKAYPIKSFFKKLNPFKKN